MSDDSRDEPPAVDGDRPSGDDDASSGASAGKKTLLGHVGDRDDEPMKPAGGPAPQVESKRRGKGKVTIVGGSAQRGQFWGNVRADKTKVGLGEVTVPIEGAGGAEEATEEIKLADPITQELNLDEIQAVGDSSPPPLRKAPPRRPPPSRKPGTRPPPPKRDSEERAAPPSRPAPPKREQSDGIAVAAEVKPEPGRPPTKPPPARKRSEPPPAPGQPVVSKRSEPPPRRSERPPTPPVRKETRVAPIRVDTPVAREVTPSPAAAALPGLEAVDMPAPSLEVRSLAELCKAELALGPDPARAARLHFEVGQHAHDHTSALKSYAAALEHNAAYLPAIRAARALHLEMGNVKKASELFAAEIALSDDPSDKAQLHFAEGCAHLDNDGDQDAARESFRAAASFDGANATVLKALQHAELRTKDWNGLARALELEANAILDDRRYRAAVVVRLGRLLERRLRKPEEALQQYEIALTLDPHTPTALAETKRLLFAQGRWHELIAAHEREASLTRDVDVRTQCYWSMGRIYSERLGATAEAITALEAAAALSPNEGLILDELARLYADMGDHTGAASALERLAAALTRPVERLSALCRLGELHERRGGKDAEAVRWFEAALALEPSFGPALSALDNLYRRTNNWTALASTYVAEGSSAPESKRRAAAYARAGDIFATRLSRPDDAVEHYTHALALDPHHEGAFKALVQLHTAAQRHRELIELYDRAVDIAPREDIAIAYMFKIGALYEDVLGEASGATATFLRILERQPDNLGAIHAVQRTAEMSGRYRDLVVALDQEAKLETNKDRVLMLQLRAAEVTHEHLGDSEGALKRLQGVLNRDAKHAAAIMAVARIHDALGQPRELLSALELQLGICADGPARVALLVRMAELCEVQLADPDSAATWYARAVAADPKHALARAALVRLLRHKRDHKELAKVLAEELDTSTDPARAARAALLLGETYEVHLSKPVDAIVAYKRSLEALPGYHPALDALARVHANGSQWKELADVLALHAGAIHDVRMAADTQVRAAALRAERLGRLDEAMAALDEVVAVDAENVAALLALEALHVEQGDDERLEALLTVESEVLEYTGGRVAAMVAQGRLLQRGGDETASALRAVCLAVLAAEPGHAWALSTLEELARKLDDRQLASDVDARYTESVRTPSLRSFYFTRLGDALLASNPAAALTAFRTALEHAPDNISAIRGLAIVGSALGDAATMVDSYRREAAFTFDDRVAADLLVRSAAVLSRLGDVAGATEDAEKALARCPDHEASAQALRALLGSQHIDRLIEQLTQAAHNARKVDRKVELWRTVGDLYLLGKKDVGSAISAVKRALVSNDEDLEAIVQLARLYIRDAQHEEAAEWLTKAVRLDDSMVAAHIELARLYTDHLGDARKARKAIERVLADDPQSREALRMLLKLNLDAGDRDQAREVSTRLLDAAGDDDDTRAWALVEIARVELAAKAPERAAEALRDAVIITGLGGDAAKLYRRLAGDHVSWNDYIKTLRGYLESGRAKDPKQVIATYLEIARTQKTRLDHPAGAFRTLDEALGRVGSDATIVLERAEMMAATGRPQEAANEFAALVSRSPYVTEAWRGLTQVMQQQGRQAEAALAASPLVVLAEATDVERNLASEHRVRPGAARPGSFGVSTLRQISAGNADGDERAAGVFAAVADGIVKAFPVPFDLYGVRKGDRIKPRSGHPLRNEVDRIAAAFAVEDVEVFGHEALAGDVALELSNPPSLMVPAYIMELPDAQRVFLLARPLAAIAAGTAPAYRLSTDDVGLLLAGAVRRLVPGFEDGEHDKDALAAMQEKLSPSWFSRGKVDEAVQHYYAEPVDVAVWAQSVAKTATRAAALLAGDLDACLSAMKYAGLVQGDKPSHELARRSPLLDDVLRFWMSDAANEARRLGGLI